MRSFAAAYEEAMKKKNKSKVFGQGLVGPGFPSMGSIQPAHMGSQSTSPMAGDISDMSANVMPPSPDVEARGGF
jgi:hypothetical protein